MTTTDTKQATAPSGTPGDPDAWRGFKGLIWRNSISVRDFIQENYTPYEGDASFLAGPTERTTQSGTGSRELFPEEREKGVLDVVAWSPRPSPRTPRATSTGTAS